MAITNSPRLGIERWSHGTDRHPPRAVWDAQQAILDDLVAIDRQYATLADRPAAGVRGTYCWVEENGVLYRDDGAQWRPIVQFGGGAGAAVVAGGSGAEGTSARTARADHSHPLPLATASAHGAMRKEDKAKLDAATGTATANTLVSRDSSGRSYFTSVGLSSDPANLTDATRKGYVDGLVGSVHVPTTIPSGANLDAYTTSGVYVQNQHTSAQAGTNYPVPYAGLLTVNTSANFVFQEYAVTRLAPGGDVVYRRTRYDGSWGAWAQSAPRSYVDEGDAAARSYADSAVAAIPEATRTRAGLMPAADKALVDAATANATGNTLARRDSSGRVSVGTPEITAHAASKGYVDAGDATRLPYGQSAGTGSIDSLLTPGHYHQASSAPVTTANGYPVNGSAGALSVLPFGTSANWVIQTFTEWTTRRTFTRATNAGATGWTAWTEWANTDTATSSADGLMSAADKGRLVGRTDADPGSLVARTSQGSTTLATLWLNNAPTTSSAATRKDYVDAGDASAQSAAEATAAAALAPVKALTDGATANATANRLVRRDSAGRFKAATPSETTDVAIKSYVDAGDAAAQSTAEATAAAALAPVKTTVDNATANATANRLVLRDSAGRFKAAAPSADTDVANRLYVDTKDQALSSLFGELDDRTTDMQATLAALTYRSELRYTSFEQSGGSGWVTLQRVGWVVEINMRLVDPFMSAGRLTQIPPLPEGFRPDGRLAYKYRGTLTFKVSGSGDFYPQAQNTPNDTYSTLTFITPDPVPESFTWGTKV